MEQLALDLALPMLDAAMERKYSGSPGSFFTGGGVQGFGNFEDSENYDSPSVTQAFAHSVNLAFVRILQDITSYYGSAGGGRRLPAVLASPDAPERDEYLHRFADTESRRYLGRFYKELHGLSANEALMVWLACTFENVKLVIAPCETPSTSTLATA